MLIIVATFGGSSLPRAFSSARGRKSALLQGRFEGKTGCREYLNDAQRHSRVRPITRKNMDETTSQTSGMIAWPN